MIKKWYINICLIINLSQCKSILMYKCNCNLKFYNTCILLHHTNENNLGQITPPISIKSHSIFQDVSIITTNKASNEVLPYGMYTTARKLCQVISQSARLRMSGTIPLLIPICPHGMDRKNFTF